MPQPCRWCGAPITWKRLVGGWVHSQPLAQFRISRRERDDVMSDPPRAKMELHRQSVIHPAQPE